MCRMMVVLVMLSDNMSILTRYQKLCIVGLVVNIIWLGHIYFVFENGENVIFLVVGNN